MIQGLEGFASSGGQQPRRKNRHWFVVSYDVTDDKRRTKVMKTLAGHGQRVQYSVFECELLPTTLEQLKHRLGQLIDAETDDVRFYLLCANCLPKATMLGKAKQHRHKSYVVV